MNSLFHYMTKSKERGHQHGTITKGKRNTSQTHEFVFSMHLEVELKETIRVNVVDANIQPKCLKSKQSEQASHLSKIVIIPQTAAFEVSQQQDHRSLFPNIPKNV
jgi:hypothetical protein